MLNENQIDKLIQPLVDRQRQIEGEVITVIAERLEKIKDILPSDAFRLERLYKTGSDAQKINKILSQHSKLSEDEIKQIIRTVGADAYADTKPFYDYRELPFIAYADNKELQNAVKAIERVTLQDYKNLANSTAFMLRDVTNPYIIRSTPLAETYQSVIDMAVQSALTGTASYNTLIPRVIRDLTQRGITAAEYTTDKGKPHRVRLDSVVRRNILDAIRNVQQTVQDITGEQFDANGVELSVHIHSAPDHEPIQGHQFSKEEYDKLQTGMPFSDVNGVSFGAIDRPIGMWNCRHFAWSIIIGEKTPNYTSEELERIKAENADGITVTDKDGNEVKQSMYWCTQQMRRYELKMRQLKEGMAAAEKAGEDDLQKQMKAQLDRKQNEYKAFCAKCGLKPRFDKTRVYM